MPDPRPSESMRPALLSLLVTVLIGLARSIGAQEPAEDPSPGFQLVAHEDVPFLALERNTIAKMFLKQIKSWPDSDLGVLPIDLADTSEVREAFTTIVHKKRISSIAKYWQRQLFSGREVSPPKVTSDDEVLQHVRTNRGAIGYVSDGAALGSGVKLFSIGPERADESVAPDRDDDRSEATDESADADEGAAEKPKRP